MRGRLALVLFALACLALQVQPPAVTVDGGPGTDFSNVFTITNDQPRPLTLTLAPHRFSTYLQDAATLSTDTLTLEPFGSKNVQVRGTIPLLGPETHHLTYLLQENEQTQANLTVDLPIQGTPTLHPKLDVSIQDAIANEPVSAEATLYNFGNINAYYALEMHIRENGERIGGITYPETLQVLPGEEQDLTLLYTDALEPGSYDVLINGTVNGKQSVQATAPFRVIIADDHRSITEGDDLILTIDGDQGSVTYTLRRNGEELLRDTQRVREEITVPTAALAPGDYELEVHVQHPKGTDTTRIDLTIKRRGLDHTTIALLLITLVLGGLLSLRPVRLRLRLLHVSWRVYRTEKTLNRLVARAHRLAEHT